MKEILKKQCGYTLTELMVVVTIFSLLLGLITINLLNSKQKASFNSSLTQLVSDIKQQQTSAMSLDTQGANTTSAYGIYFGQTSYTLFRGSAYVATDGANFVINLGENVQFSSVSFPGSSIIFQKLSGEILGFNPNLNSVTIKGTQNNQQKTIQINRYGVITQAN